MASSSAVSLSSFCLCSRFLVKESEDFWIILSARRKERGTAAAASSVGLILLLRHFLFKFLTFFSTQERRHKIDTRNTSIFKFGFDLIFCFSRKENGVFQCLLIIIIIIIIILNVPSFKVSLSLFLSIIICLLHTILNYIPACISLFVWDIWNLKMGIFPVVFFCLFFGSSLKCWWTWSGGRKREKYLLCLKIEKERQGERDHC